MTEKIADSALTFATGDEALLYQDTEQNERYWFANSETFWRVERSEQVIDFWRLTEDGDDYYTANKDKATDTYYVQAIDLIESINHASKMKFPGEPRGKIFSYTVPLPSAMNALRRTRLEPHGSHDVPLVAQRSDRGNGEFSAVAIVSGLADRYVAVGTEGGMFAHDMRFHSLGIAGIEREAMHRVLKISQFIKSQEQHDALLAEKAAIAIAHSLDYTTFQFSSGIQQFNPVRRDPLLNYILKLSRNLPHSYFSEIASIIGEPPYSILRHSARTRVVRSKKVTNYYVGLNELLGIDVETSYQQLES